jgi:hypothetical protein
LLIGLFNDVIDCTAADITVDGDEMGKMKAEVMAHFRGLFQNLCEGTDGNHRQLCQTASVTWAIRNRRASHSTPTLSPQINISEVGLTFLPADLPHSYTPQEKQ